MNVSIEIDELAKQARGSLRKGETARAIELFEQALTIDADRADLHEGLAAAHYQAKNYEEAIKHFEAVGRLRPTEAKADINIGAIYNLLHRYHDAVKSLRRGLAKDRKCSLAYYNLGTAYRGMGQLSMAVSAYREAVRFQPEMAEAHLNLGSVYLKMGSHYQAIQHFKRALELRPGFDRAERGLIEAERAREQAKQAVSPFGRLVDENQPAAAQTPRLSRPLSEVERLKDRKTLLALCEQAEAEAQRLLECLRRELEPQMLALLRAATRTEGSRAALEEAHPAFRAAVGDCRQIRKALKDKMNQLRAHEERILSDKGD